MDRDRRLAEMMGMCWHEWGDDEWMGRFLKHTCAKCQWEESVVFGKGNPDFSTPEWRAKLMDFCVDDDKHHGWLFWMFVDWTWDRFVDDKLASGARMGDLCAYLWRNLATLLVEYHGEGRE